MAPLRSGARVKKLRKVKKVDSGRLVGVVEVLVGVGDHVDGGVGSVGRDGAAGVVYSRVSPDPPGTNPLNLHQIEPGFLL